VFTCITGIFEDSEVTHVLDTIDPVRDLEIINEELMLKDIATVSAEVVALEKVVGREKHRKPELVCQY
jgi:obg-like ATPase 1